MSIEDEIKDLIARSCGVSVQTLRPQAALVEYGLDSVRAMDLLVSLEETFSISVPDAVAERLKTIDDCVRYVCTKLEAQEPDAPDAGAAVGEDLEPALRHMLEQVLASPELAARIRYDESFSDHGLDSLAIVKLIEGVESTFQISVGEDDLQDTHFATLRGLQRFVRSKLSAGEVER